MPFKTNWAGGVRLELWGIAHDKCPDSTVIQADVPFRVNEDFMIYRALAPTCAPEKAKGYIMCPIQAVNTGWRCWVYLARRRRPVSCDTGLPGCGLDGSRNSGETLRFRPIWLAPRAQLRGRRYATVMCGPYSLVLRRRLTADAEVDHMAAEGVRKTEQPAHVSPRVAV